MEYPEDEYTHERMGRKKNRSASARGHEKYMKSLRKKDAIDRRIERRKEIREISPELKAKVYRVYGRKCYICGKKGANTLDHVIPIIKGGTTTLENLRPAHYDCNQEKGGKIIVLPLELKEKGW